MRENTLSTNVQHFGLLTTVSQQGKTYLEQDGQFIAIPQLVAGNITDSSVVDGAFYAPNMMDNQVINYAIEKVKNLRL